ncbi:MAG: hypothetical protein ACRDIB_10330, partial [Ardenticatenaceae bacterium]
TVDEVMNALAGLDEMQLRTVRAYEVNHKNRVTVLRAIDEQLAQKDELHAAATSAKTMGVNGMGTPIANYDELNAQEVESALEGLDLAQLGAVRAYELSHKNRVTVLRAIDQKLGQ